MGQLTRSPLVAGRTVRQEVTISNSWDHGRTVNILGNYKSEVVIVGGFTWDLDLQFLAAFRLRKDIRSREKCPETWLGKAWQRVD